MGNRQQPMVRMGSGLLAGGLAVSFILDVTLAKDLNVRGLRGNWARFPRYKDWLRPGVRGERLGWKSEQGREGDRGQNKPHLLTLTESCKKGPKCSLRGL